MSADGIVKLMSVDPSVDVFCTIMSSLTLASASGSNSDAEIPGLSGTPSTVTFDSPASVTLAIVSCRPRLPSRTERRIRCDS